MVAREERALLGKREGEVVHRVAGRRHSLQRVALASEALAIGQHARGHMIEIVGGGRALDLVGVRWPERDMRPAAEDRRARLSREKARRGRVVAMRVRHQDLRDALARQRAEQGGAMLRQVGPGIDHADRAVSDDVGVGALEGHRPGVRRHHEADQRRQRHQRAVLAVEGVRERQVLAHAGSVSPASRSSSAAFGGAGG